MYAEYWNHHSILMVQSARASHQSDRTKVQVQGSEWVFYQVSGSESDGDVMRVRTEKSHTECSTPIQRIIPAPHKRDARQLRGQHRAKQSIRDRIEGNRGEASNNPCGPATVTAFDLPDAR